MSFNKSDIGLQIFSHVFSSLNLAKAQFFLLDSIINTICSNGPLIATLGNHCSIFESSTIQNNLIIFIKTLSFQFESV